MQCIDVDIDLLLLMVITEMLVTLLMKIMVVMNHDDNDVINDDVRDMLMTIMI